MGSPLVQILQIYYRIITIILHLDKSIEKQTLIV